MPNANIAWFLVHPKGLVVVRQDGRARLPTDAELGSLGLEAGANHELEKLGEQSALAVEVPRGFVPQEPFAVMGLRELFGHLGEQGLALAGRASQVIEWAATHKFCGRCATPTAQVEHERCMKCPKCGLTAYPRISPAIIVLVRRGEEALLARNAHFPGAFYSTLAGFSEIGETLEETLVREVREEVSIDVTNPRYFGSQPWPFPHSLMIGYTADYAGGEIKVDGAEIAEARWFKADALPSIPPKLSIARRLIDHWLADVTKS